MNILSIQSHVAFGHVGNDAAVFPLQRLGIEVWPVHTLQFSNHPGYGAFRGSPSDPAAIVDVLRGIEERGAFATCDGVLTGYLGSAAIGAAALDAVARIKRANPKALYCCDPVMGDSGKGLYVADTVVSFMPRAVAAADILTPNHFELETLCGRRLNSRADIAAALDALHARGPRVILVTSLQTDDTPPDCTDLVVSERAGKFCLRTPRLPASVNGAGDMIAALFLGHYLRSGSPAQALSRAASSVFGVIARSVEAGSRELALVAAQDEIVSPTRVFAPEPFGAP